MLLKILEQLVDKMVAVIPRPQPQLKSQVNARLIAHRGAHHVVNGLRENTLESFRKAKELGCWGIEFDVQTTADGIYVVHHDFDLKRIWKKPALIKDLTLAQLQELVPQVPTLEAVVSEFGSQMHLFIEIKDPKPNPQALETALKNLSPIQDYHLLTLDASIFDYLSSFPAQALLLVASEHNVKQFCELSIKKPYGGVLGNYLLMTNKHIDKLARAKQRCGVGFVNSKNSVYREMNRGIPWLFTDKAHKVASYIKSKG